MLCLFVPICSHFRSDPQRSLLLMGRSGTGKTTCLVFRMWAQYHHYIDGQHGARPRQLFLTKNDVLCREVKVSTGQMTQQIGKEYRLLT